MKNYSDTRENYNTLSEKIEEYGMTAEQLLIIFTNYHSLQLLDRDFMEYLESEGY